MNRIIGRGPVLKPRPQPHLKTDRLQQQHRPTPNEREGMYYNNE